MGQGASWGELVGRTGKEGRLSLGSERDLFWLTDTSRRCVQLLRGHLGDQWTWFWSCTSYDGSRPARACFQQAHGGGESMPCCFWSLGTSLACEWR